MIRLALLPLLCLGVLACTPVPPDTSPKPNESEGTSYHLAGGGTSVLKCNTWGFDTICRSE